ncbi:hypothetical protein [Nocardia sp. CDC160]|uniref:hypothetical protein n=1 Tax=Nocardia sp. CDC160 TaxID=3112166 RepID=UPI002DBEE41B|nr:hypothetical protein [Nocardia sp. CDC160]MEC3920281.1 hypothetical protein [Nocardia sp. CDC160]
MVRPLPPHVSGEMVRIALLEARPAGLTLRQLCAATDLTPAQVRSGLGWIRKVTAAEHMTPLTYNRVLGYALSDDEVYWIAAERGFFRMELTRITRMLTAVLDPHRARQPVDGSNGDDWIRLVLEQVGGVRATFEMLTRLKV